MNLNLILKQTVVNIMFNLPFKETDTIYNNKIITMTITKIQTT
jgi:hypothetical protein